MDTAQWPQETGVMRTSRAPYPKEGDNHNKVARPQKEQGLNCPRCNSTNTKFCYYNNYSLSQPRYFCKTCRRYWTAGGSLRNIPVGGGSRKNKRPNPTTSSSSNNNSSAKHVKLNPPNPTVLIDHHHQDLGLSFSRGFMGSFMMPAGPVQDPGPVYTTGFSSLQDHHSHQFMKPSSLGFSLDGFGLGATSFPLQDLKQQAPSSSTRTHDQDQEHDQDHDHQENGDHMINISSGYWSGMLGGTGGGSW